MSSKRRTSFFRKGRKKKSTGRQDARRFATTVSMWIVLAGMVVGLIGAANKWMAKERLEALRIEGRVILDSAEIAERADLDSGQLLKGIDLEEVEQRVASHPFVASASVWRGDGGTLVIDLKERSPVAVALVGGTPVYLDSGAAVLPYRFGAAAPDVPVVDGVVVRDSTGERIDSLRALEALGVVRTVRAQGGSLYQRIAAVQRDARGGYTLVLTDGAVPVIAGRPDEIGPRLSKLEAFVNNVLPIHGPRNAERIDIRWDGQVVVRWKGENRQT